LENGLIAPLKVTWNIVSAGGRELEAPQNTGVRLL